MGAPLKNENVIQNLIEAVELGQLIPSSHAALRMKERKIDFSDVEEAIYRAVREEVKDSLTRRSYVQQKSDVYIYRFWF